MGSHRNIVGHFSANDSWHGSVFMRNIITSRQAAIRLQLRKICLSLSGQNIVYLWHDMTDASLCPAPNGCLCANKVTDPNFSMLGNEAFTWRWDISALFSWLRVFFSIFAINVVWRFKQDIRVINAVLLMQHHQREKRSKVFKAHAFGNGQNNKEKTPGTFKKIKEHHVRHVLLLLLTYTTVYCHLHTW